MTKQQTNRKRCVWLLLSTAAVIAAMLWYDAAVAAAVLRVETVTLRACTVEDTVLLSGTVRATEGTEVAVSVPCVAGDVTVAVGDRVSAGDVLMQVDRAGTLAMAVGAGLSEDRAVAASAALPQTVTAPHDGVVSAVSVAKGDRLASGTPCVVLSENGDVEIAVTLRESMVPLVEVGQKVTVSGVAFRRDRYRGTVTAVASSARNRLVGAATETVVDAVVTLDPEEADESLLIGLNAKASVTLSRRDGVLLIPYDCMTSRGDGTASVYCLQEGTAYRRTVTLGKEYPDGAEAVSGLCEGERVVRAPERLDGDAVKVTEGAP